MSAESAISNLLNTLQAVSASALAGASALVQQADSYLQALAPPTTTDLTYSVKRDRPDLKRLPRPPALPGLQPVELPEMGELQPILQIEDRFTTPAPTLASLRFPSLSLEEPPSFSGTAPAADPLTIHPIVPTLTPAEPPTLTVPTAVRVDPVSGDPPNVPLPAFPTFHADLYATYRQGLADSDLAPWSAFLATQRADLAPLETALRDRLRHVLSGTVTALPESWESQRYDQERQGIHAARRDAHQAFDAAPGAVTGLPTGAAVTGRLSIELTALRAITQAAATVANDRQGREVQHLQGALTLAGTLVTAALNLRAQEAGWRMKGLMTALDGAEATLALAVRVLEMQRRALVALVHYNETQVRRTEDRLQIEKTKLEAFRVTLASEKLKGTYNAHQARVAEIVASFLEARVTLFKTQIDYLTVDAAWRKLALQAYEADVAAYRALVNGHAAQASLISAMVQQDRAQVDAELGKVRLYEADLRAQGADAQALAAKAKAQADQNRGVLAAYQATVEAKLDELRAVDTLTQQALVAMAKGFETESAEQELQLGSQELKDQATLHEALRDLRLDQTEALKALKIYQLRLDQAQANGKVMADGAATLGGMAKQALSDMNAVGTRQAVEEG